jgi:hypothetical protein
MGGGRIPGPICGERLGDDPIARPGFTDPIPLGGGKSTSGSVKLVGWPRAIRWSEFTEVDERPAGEKEAAKIHSEVIQPDRVDVTRENGQFRVSGYTAKLEIFKDDSWVVKDQKSETLRVHEQGHYDITGLIGRDMVNDIGAIRASSTDDLQSQVQAIIKNANELGDRLTKLYDGDQKGGTSGGSRPTEQAAWNAHLKSCMDNNTRLTGAP